MDNIRIPVRMKTVIPERTQLRPNLPSLSRMNTGFPVDDMTEQLRILLSRTILSCQHKVPQRFLDQAGCFEFLFEGWKSRFLGR